jgi:hypothetical protein
MKPSMTQRGAFFIHLQREEPLPKALAPSSHQCAKAKAKATALSATLLLT